MWRVSITAFGLVGDNLRPALVFLAIAGGADVVSAMFRNTVQQLTVPDGPRGRSPTLDVFVVARGPRLDDLEGGLVASAFSISRVVVVIATTEPRCARRRVRDPL